MKKNVSIFLFFLFFLSSLHSLEELDLDHDSIHKKPLSNQILFLVQSGNIGRAIDLYHEHTAQLKEHDFHLLQEMGHGLLDLGFRTRNPEIQLLTLFGAGISLNEKTLYLLESAMRSDVPQLQLVALNFLARYQTDSAIKALESGMRSDFLPIRLEAAFHLCSQKHKSAVAHTESLMYKLPPEILPLFPQFFASIGNPTSTRILKRLLNHSEGSVRVEAILSAAKFKRDDLLPLIRTLATHHDMAQQEACAYALGELRDETSVPLLKKIAESKAPQVRLAAMRALYQLGRKEVKESIEQAALAQDLFAIYLLGEIPESEGVLHTLTQNSDALVRINATLALLQHADARCLKPLCEVLIRDSRDLAFIPYQSLGKSFVSWKVIPSASVNLKETPALYELSLNLREEALAKSADLQEDDFIPLAELILHLEQDDLVPVLVRLLENMHTKRSVELLKNYSQKAGAPLIRNYCNLALYRMGEKGPYFDNLKHWILAQQNIDLIRFRPIVPLEMRWNKVRYELTPEEASRLLVEAFESFLLTQDDRGINILLHTIRNGNKNNKYVLAGLLIRATL